MRVLIPTDFSESSIHAIRYAANLTETHHTELILLHAWTITPPYPEFAEYVAAMDTSYFGERAMKRTREFINRLHDEYPFFGTPLTREGFAPDVILDAMEELKPDLTVMGRRGMPGIGRAVFGSITSAVVKKAAGPVLIVPEKAPVVPLQEAAFATDFHESDLQALQLLVKIAKPHGSHLNAVHFNVPGTGDHGDGIAFESYEKHIRSLLRYAGLSFETVDCQDLREGVDSYLVRKNIQLLALAGTARSRWQQLFEPSLTRHVMRHLQVPLLVVGEWKKENGK